MDKRLKKPFFVLVFLISGMFLRAQDGFFDFDTSADFPQYPEYWEDNEDAESSAEDSAIKKFRLKNRMVELSIANISFYTANNYFTAADILENPFFMLGNIRKIRNDPVLIYKDPIVINIDNFSDGFKFDMGVSIKPVSLNFNWKDRWGIGLDIGHVDAWGNLTLPEKLLALKQTEKEIIGAGGAIFADAGIPVFFYYNNLKIKFRPSVYVPFVYTVPNIVYSYTTSVNPQTGKEGTRLAISYDMRIYSVISMRGIGEDKFDPQWQDFRDNFWNILGKNAGYDFGLGMEYPLIDELDIGVDASNIPIPYAGSRLNHFCSFYGETYFDSSAISVGDLLGNGNIPDEVYKLREELTVQYGYDSNGKRLYRPFAMLFYANYRPFNSPVLTLIPSLGFSISRLYLRHGAVEGGVNVRFDHANILVTTIGMNYNDRRWKNSIDIALNLRACEFDIGLSMQSQDFKKSWRGAGMGINIGTKFGW